MTKLVCSSMQGKVSGSYSSIKTLHIFCFRFAGYFQSKPGSGGVPGAQHYNQRTQSGDSQGSEYRSPALKLADFARNNQEMSTNGERKRLS